MARTFVTTTDNPANYFTQYDEWIAWDEIVCGYYTKNYVARIAVISPDFSEEEMERAVEDAVDEIIEMDLRYISPVTGKEVCYVKVVEPETDNKKPEAD